MANIGISSNRNRHPISKQFKLAWSVYEPVSMVSTTKWSLVPMNKHCLSILSMTLKLGAFSCNLDGMSFIWKASLELTSEFVLENALIYPDSSTGNTAILANSQITFDLSNKVYQKRNFSDPVSKSAYAIDKFIYVVDKFQTDNPIYLQRSSLSRIATNAAIFPYCNCIIWHTTEDGGEVSKNIIAIYAA